MSTLSLDPSVTLFEPAAASPAAASRRGQPSSTRVLDRPQTAVRRGGAGADTLLRTPDRITPPLPQHGFGRPAASTGARPTDDTRHGRHSARPASPRGRRASAASTLSPSVVAAGARLVAVRAAGTGLAAAAVTVVLAGKQNADAGTVAELSVRGLAVAAILCAAWGFQDRSRLGALQTARTWFWTAAVIGLAHALWIVATMPGGAVAQLAAALSAFALDAVLVAAPALLGARAGRPDLRPALP